jgi:FkbM family methyltransferase
MAFQLILGRLPLPHEMAYYASFSDSPEKLGLRLIASKEFRKHAMLGEFPAGTNQRVCAEIRDRLKLWVDLMDAGVSAGAIADNWEPAETHFILSILQSGNALLDIGAHIGWFTVLGAHRVGPQGRVFAFEPRPAIFAYLRASVEANGFAERCVLHCAALSDKRGTTSMAVFTKEFNTGHAFMVAGEVPEGASLVTDIPTMVLDNIPFDRKIDLIKIDVEGAEAMILRGGRELLQRDQPVIVSELFPCWLRSVSGESPEDFFDFLRTLGYRLFELTELGVGREFHTLRKWQSASDDYFTNVVALTDDHIGRYLLRPLDRRIEAYQDEIVRIQDEVERIRIELSTERERRIRDEASSHERLAEFSEQNVSLIANNLKLEKQVLNLEQELSILSRREVAKTEKLLELTSQNSEFARKNKELSAQVSTEIQKAEEVTRVCADLSTHLAIIQTSNAWRACLVLIRLAGKLPASVRRPVVRILKLLWWTSTGQLPQRWRAWRERNRESVTANPANEQILVQTQKHKPEEDLSKWANRRGPVALIVDDRWPEPDRDSGSVDAVNLVRNLVELGFEVVFAVASDLVQDERYRKGLVDLGAQPLARTGAAYVQRYIEDNRHVFTLVVLTRVSCGGALFELVRYNSPDAKIIFNTVDLHFLREYRAAILKNDKAAVAQAQATRDREEWLVGRADLTIVVSEMEQEILSAAVPRAPILHLPLTRDISVPQAPFSKRQHIGFVGGFAHAPNIDAIQWLLTEIWPSVRKRMPDLTLSIVGSNLPKELVKTSDGVIYLGPVDDLHAWFETLIISVAPLRIGAGAKGKVASSLASGVPCVLSTIAAEGMNLTDGENVLIADSPEVFVDKIVSLCNDAEQWNRLSAEALRFARSQLSHEVNRDRLHAALIGIGVPVREAVAKRLVSHVAREWEHPQNKVKVG